VPVNCSIFLFWGLEKANIRSQSGALMKEAYAFGGSYRYVSQKRMVVICFGLNTGLWFQGMQKHKSS